MQYLILKVGTYLAVWIGIPLVGIPVFFWGVFMGIAADAYAMGRTLYQFWRDRE